MQIFTQKVILFVKGKMQFDNEVAADPVYKGSLKFRFDFLVLYILVVSIGRTLFCVQTRYFSKMAIVLLFIGVNKKYI